MDNEQAQFSQAFEEWKRRYDADPGSYESWEDFQASPPASYGEAAARYFIHLLQTLDQINSGAVV